MRRRPQRTPRNPRRALLARTSIALVLPSLVALPEVAVHAAAAPEVQAVPTPGAAAWRQASIGGHRLPDPETASPAEVRRFFASLRATQARALAARYPWVVGRLDGAPFPLRYEANRAAAREAGPRYASWAAPGRQLLAFDPRGDGQAAEVVGDLARARRVAVLVPGSDVTLGNFVTGTAKHPERAQLWKARTLLAAMRAADPRTPAAVVAWLGYDPPEGLGLAAARDRRAVTGSRALARFVDGLDPARRAVTTICHSYGTVVCGLAARRLHVTDIVAIGSPGMRASSAAALHTPARVWSARAAGDWTRFIPDLTVLGLGHGADPNGHGFGARHFATGTAHGHDHYFTPGSASLANLARIALGRDSEVTR